MTDADAKEPEAVSHQQDITTLIERLELAKGPDRELDLAIHIILWSDGDIAKLTTQYRRGLDHREGMAWDFWHSGSIVFEKRDADGTCPYNGGYPLPFYTASIDAALTLVPEGWEWALFREGDDNACRAEIGDPMLHMEGEAITPAIALCIAALRVTVRRKEHPLPEA